MAKVFIVNPSNSTVGYSVITPRWLFVIAQGTPTDLVGDPVIIDEPVKRFDPNLVNPGDIVGIGIHTGNCIPGYRVLRQAKARGAIVIMGGIHATIFPKEPLEMGADAVVTGNGDLVWEQAVRDALAKKLQPIYVGGRVAGDAMLKARWDLLDSKRYMMASVQTVAGCPENCNFCSVWVTDGRKPRQHKTEKIIAEANELYKMGFRYLFFADDNFNPSTWGRIAREQHAQTRKELERLREERLKFFDEYDRSVPKSLYAFTQMTSEVISDEEYLSAMYEKMRIRGALIGIESFSEEGLKSANKLWNPSGQKMVETIRRIQDHGIVVLSSIICGLESDTLQTIQTMREFAKASGTAMAQFPIYSPYPGTKDFYEMMTDRAHNGQPGYTRKHRIEILYDKFWLDHHHSEIVIEHPNMNTEELVKEVQASWRSFYSLSEILKRTKQGLFRSLPWGSKVFYCFGSLAFRTLYRNGIAADNVRDYKMGWLTKLALRIAFYLIRNRDYLRQHPLRKAKTVPS